MEILSTTTITDRNIFKILTKTIADQYSQITTLTNKLLAATEAAAKLKTEIATINRYNGYSGQGSGCREDNQSNSWLRRPLDPNGSFWTHGFKVSCNHNSKSCTTKKPGYKDEPTRTNNMGGFRWNKHHKFE